MQLDDSLHVLLLVGAARVLGRLACTNTNPPAKQAKEHPFVVSSYDRSSYDISVDCGLASLPDIYTWIPMNPLADLFDNNAI